MSTRATDFATLTTSLTDELRFSSEEVLIAEGDSLALLKKMPSHSVTLILTDPPYHVTKKKNIYGDTAFAEDQHYLDWLHQYSVEWKRVLKPNGSLFCFCASKMASRLELTLATEFKVLSHVVWTKPNAPGFDGWKGKMRKEALRQWYPHSERILFAEPSLDGKSPFAVSLRTWRKQAGLSMSELTASIGAHGAVNHGGAVSNWEAGRTIPSREHYVKLRQVLVATGKVADLPEYEDAVRVFAMTGSQEFTDVWTFPSVRPYPGKHPAEKPTALLEHAIAATTHADDIVLDCFGGSGSIIPAARKLHRKVVCLEIEPQWIKVMLTRLSHNSLS